MADAIAKPKGTTMTQAPLKLPHIIVLRVDGGLGSQILQYALGLALEKKSGLMVMHYLSWYNRSGKNLLKTCNRNFELPKVFKNIHIRRVPDDIAKAFYTAGRYTEETQTLTDSILHSPVPRFLNGYLLGTYHLVEMREELLNTFAFNITLEGANRKIVSSIFKSPAPVALHIRRGDFAAAQAFHPMLSMEYYHNAMHTMASLLNGVAPEFFVFSDDMVWARAALSHMPYTIHYIDNNTNDEARYDLFLMSQCAHFIIANSSFSWCAAFLSTRSKDAVVLEPFVPPLEDNTPRLGSFPTHLPGWHSLPIDGPFS